MMNTKFNKIIHLLFVSFGLYLVVLQNNYSDAIIYFGLALAFDPFDVNRPWKNRPIWQKGILVVELILTLALIMYSIWAVKN